MGIRGRTVSWIVVGLLLLPLVLLGALLAYLAWSPVEPQPLSKLVGPPTQGSAMAGRG